MKTEATKTLKQIQKVIQSLEARKMEIIQDQFAMPLMEIVSIARKHDLSVDLIAHALRQKEPREVKSLPRRNKRSNVSGTTPSEVSIQ
jgi:hypothetical protein